MSYPRPIPVLSMLLLAAAAVSSACAARQEPDMSRMTAIAAFNGERQPLILIHGFMGSKLRDPQTHKVAWGTMTNVLMGGDSDDLALSLDDGSDSDVPGEALEPYQIYESLWGVDYYREAIRSLREAGGYQIGDIEHPRPGDNAFVFIYDWRRDNVESARRLAAAIEHLKEARGDPAERFDLVAHSQGGLIARYYVKYGDRDVVSDGPPFVPTMAGAPNVNKVILIGTPNQGCLQSLRILHHGVKKGFRPMRPEVVFTMPAVFQMLPPQGTMVFEDDEGAPLPLDLYDAENWERNQWSVFSAETQKRIARKMDGDRATLDRHNERLRGFLQERLLNARTFHEALDAPEPAGTHVEYHAFGGDCLSTLKTATVSHKNGAPLLLFDDKNLYGPGDGTVLMASLLGLSQDEDEVPVAFSSASFVCGQHGVLPNNPTLKNNLLYLLLFNQGAGARTRAASVP